MIHTLLSAPPHIWHGFPLSLSETVPAAFWSPCKDRHIKTGNYWTWPQRNINCFVCLCKILTSCCLKSRYYRNYGTVTEIMLTVIHWLFISADCVSKLRTIPASRKCFSISGAWGINGTLFVEVEHGIVYKQRYQIFIYRDNRFYSWLFTIVADRDMGIPW